MSSMTTSASATPTRRLVLVPAASSAARADAAVRRFRLARLRLEGRDVARSERFDHLRRCYD
jgi:hypothetical protein